MSGCFYGLFKAFSIAVECLKLNFLNGKNYSGEDVLSINREAVYNKPTRINTSSILQYLSLPFLLFLLLFLSTVTLSGQTGPLQLQGTGGSITQVNISGQNYVVHTFTTTGTSSFTPPPGVTSVEYLVVAGGGGGGGISNVNAGGGAGGGAGGLLSNVGGTAYAVTNQAYTVVVGAGGTGGSDGNRGGTGGNSTFATITANGGGGGGSTGATNGANGGSGGGGRFGQNGGTGIAGQGYNGANGPGGTIYSAGGGGGASASAVTPTTNTGGFGGNGLLNSINGSSFYYAGGGAGGGYGTGVGGTGGLGGGGNSPANRGNGIAGTANTGGGGGGATGSDGTTAQNGGAGGSGIVIIRYQAPTITLTTQPSANISSGQSFAQAAVVRILDSSGNPISGISITAAIESGTGTLNNTTASTNASGYATFSNLTITGNTFATYTLNFTAQGSSSKVISNTITIIPTSPYVISTPGTSSFVVPDGVTCIQVEAWGAGGGGGQATGNPAAGGGGAGGAYARSTFAVTPGQTYSVVVGSGGTGGTGAGGTGGESYFNNTTTVYAQGGNGGALAQTNNSNGNGGIWSSNLSVGDVVFSGGNGSNGNYNNNNPGGAGGGGAGSASNGNNASGGTGGAANGYGGAGANGVANNTAGAPGSPYGGGGSGGKARTNTDRNGGTGAPGQIIITWGSVPSTNTPIVTSPIFNAATTISGTSEANAAIVLYANGSQIGTATANGSGAWSATVGAVTSGQNITATAKVNDKCLSAASTAVTVVPPATITTGTISFTNICAGATVNVPYTISGTFNSGNVFTAQLSNAAGSFAVPTNIGTLASQTAGTISATIPVNQAAGTGYLIRVVGSAPVITGSNNGVNLTVLTATTPTTTGANICIGTVNGTTLSASGAVSGEVYKWYDAATSGTLLKTSADYTDNTYTTPVIGVTTNYWVSILNAAGCESPRAQVTATSPATSPDAQTTFGTDSWIGHVYDGTNLNTYYGTLTETETFNESFGGNNNCITISSSLGTRTIYAETFSVIYQMTSTKSGLYAVNLGSDDGSRLTVDGTLLYNNWGDQAFTSRPSVLLSLKNPSSLVYEFYENGGGNQVVFQNLTLVLANSLSTNTSQTICLGNAGTAIGGDVYGTLPTGITLSGTGYQWAYSTNSASGPWTDISGATSATYTPSSAAAPFNAVGTYYIIRKAVLSSTNNVNPNPYVATHISNAATLVVNTIPAQPSAITGSATPSQGSSQTYSVTNIPGTTYTWSFPSGWTQTGGGTSNSVTVTVGSTSGNITVTPSNGCGSGTARTLAVTVSICISSQPSSVTVCINDDPTFSITTTAGTRQWQVSTNGGGSWNNITAAGTNPTYSGYTTQTLTLTNVVKANNGYQYRCVVSGSCSATSEVATLNVGIDKYGPQLSFSDPLLDDGESTIIHLSNTQIGLNYQLYAAGTAVGSPVAGNGGTISFGSYSPAVSTNYTVRATSQSSGCASDLIDKRTLIVNEDDLIIDLNPCAGQPGSNFFTNSEFGTTTSNYGAIQPNQTTNPGVILGNALGATYTTYTFGFDGGGEVNDGYYVITNSTNGMYNSPDANDIWLDIYDHTQGDGTGHMYVVNASIATGNFYTETLSNLCDSTKYEFSADFINLYSSNYVPNGSTYQDFFPTDDQGDRYSILPNIDFLINGKVAFNTGNIMNDGSWHTVGFTFRSGGLPNITLTMRNNSTGGIGNDIAIDNIVMRACGPEIDLQITTVPAIVCPGQPVTMTGNILASDYNSPVYQWQKSTNNGNSWTNLTGFTVGPTSTTYVENNPVYGHKYRFITGETTQSLTNPNCYVASNVITIETTADILTTTPATRCGTGTVTLGATANSGSVINWYSDAGGTNLVGTGVSYTTPSLSTTTTYYVNASKDGCTSPLQSVVATVYPSAVSPSVSIAVSPGTNICSGNTVTFTATPTNGGTAPLYQWRKNGVNISGATNSTYTSSSIVNNDVITCVMTENPNNDCITGSPGTATSNPITMTVGAMAASVSIAVNPGTSICNNNMVTFTATPTNGGSIPTYQWKLNGTNISGETNPTYTTSSLASGSQITCVMTSSFVCATGNPATSNTITMTVNPLPTITSPGTIASVRNRSISQSTTLAYSATTQSPTSYTIDWNATANAAGFTDQGTTAFTFLAGGGNVTGIIIPANVPEGTYSGTMTITNANGCSATQAVSITVLPMTIIDSHPVSLTLCEGENGSFTVVSTEPGVTYQWQYSVNLINWANTNGAAGVSGHNSNELTITGALLAYNGVYVRCLVTDGAYTEETAPPALFTVNPLPAISSIAIASVCFSASSQLATLTYTAPANSPTSFSIDWNAAANLAGLNDQALTAFNFNTGGGTLTGIDITAGTSPGTYQGTMTLHNANGCENTLNVGLTIRPLPDAGISGTASVCINSTAPDITFTNLVNLPVTISYNINGGGTQTINVGASTTATVQVATSTAGDFTYTLESVEYQDAPACNQALNASATVTVEPENTAGAPSSTPSLCINTALTDITHSTSGATGIGTPVDLPAGLSASWSANTITISGTPTESGIFNYSIPLAGGCGTVNATGSITVYATPAIDNPGNKTSCGDYTLPAITGTDLTGNKAYYTATSGGGTQYHAGDKITAALTTLYIYDSNNGCSDEESFTITIKRFNLVVSPNGSVDCPILSTSSNPPFNAENSSYHPGATEVTFRVEPDPAYSYSAGWSFSFTLNGTVLTTSNPSTVSVKTLEGDDATAPQQTSGNTIFGVINAGNNTWVDLTFQLVNTPGSAQELEFAISNANDGAGCIETEAISDNEVTFTLEAMPEVGAFN